MNSNKEATKLASAREIEVLVAEQIMGWQLETDKNKLKKLQTYFTRDEARKWWRVPEGGWYCDAPPYSSDIAAAWRIVENMNSRGYSLFLSQGSEKASAAFDEPHTTSPDYISEKSVARAICEAALVVAQRAQFRVRRVGIL